MKTICDNSSGTSDKVVIRRHIEGGEPENRFVVKPGEKFETESTSYRFEVVDTQPAEIAEIESGFELNAVPDTGEDAPE
jgi:hypothetical protein